MAGGQTVGSLLIRIGADTSALTKSLDKVERSMMKFSGKMENIGRTLSTAITLPIVAMGAAALKAAADYEQLEVSFQTLLKSAEKGSKFFADLKDFAAKTPFEMKEVAAAAKVMLGYGFSADETNKQLQILGDVAAATGGDIEGLSVIMGQGAALGKFMTVDLKQLAMRGIPILDALADQLGVTASEVMEMASLSQISYPMVSKAIADMSKEGGPYFNAMQNQSKTLGGLFSTLKDTAVAGFAEIGMSIKETFKLDQVIVQFTDKINNLVSWFKNLSDEQRKAIVITAAVAAAIGPLLLGFATITKVVTTAVMGFKGLLGAVSLLTNPIGLVVVGIAALAAGLVYAWNKSDAFREAVGRMGVVLQDVGKSIAAVWSSLKNSFGGIVQGIWDSVKTLLSALGSALETFAKFAFAIVLAYFKAVKEVVGRLEKTVDYVGNVVKKIADSKFGQTIKSASDSVVQAVVSGAEALANLPKNLGFAEEEIKRFGHGARGMVEKLEPATDEVTALDEILGSLTKGLDTATKGTEKLGAASEKMSGGLEGKFRSKAASFAFVVDDRSGGAMEKLKTDIPQVSSLLSGLNMQVSKVRDTIMQGASGISTFMEKLGTGIQGFADMFGEAINMLDQTVQQMFANQAAAIDANYQKQLAAINGSRMSEEQKQKAIQALDEATDKKKKALMRKQAVREKLMALFQAAINTAGAIINALKTDPTGILAAIVGGISAVQIGLIAGAKLPALAEGALAYGPSMAMVGDNANARINPEVIAPLDKLKGMMGGGNSKVDVTVKGVIAGKDILLVQERAQQDRQRTRGF